MCSGCGLRKLINQAELPGLLTFGQVSRELPWTIVWEEPNDTPGAPGHPPT